MGNTRRLILVLSLLACANGCGCATFGRADPADHDAVVDSVARLFDAMASKDESAMRGLLDAEVAIVVIDARAGTIVTTGTQESFISGVLSGRRRIREQMYAPEVRVDGDLATLWARYELWLGATFSHCGADAFQLVRRDGGWRIVGIAFTRRYDDCRPAELESGDG